MKRQVLFQHQSLHSHARARDRKEVISPEMYNRNEQVQNFQKYTGFGSAKMLYWSKACV